MDKEGKQLNIFLLTVVAIGAVAAFFTPSYEIQAQGVQMPVAEMEVSREVYRAIYTLSLTCDINALVGKALAIDNKITKLEAEEIAGYCAGEAVDKADKPFQRGKLKLELDYSRNGGVSM